MFFSRNKPQENSTVEKSGSMNTTVNGSGFWNCSSLINPEAGKIGATVALSLSLVFSLVGNSLIVLIVYKTQTLRKPINLLIANMAISDLLYPTFLFPVTTRAMCVKIVWKGCEKCVKKRNHVKSMLAKIQVHHISISHACELFDMRVKFCNTCEKFLSYVWTFFPSILLHVKSFHTCETILSCMWTSNFTCIIDAMHVKFFTCMWTLLGMSEWACYKSSSSSPLKVNPNIPKCQAPEGPSCKAADWN